MQRLMIFIRKPFWFLLGLLSLNSSCFENVTSDIDPIEFLSGTWQLQGGTVFLPGTGSVDLLEGIESCERDDLLILSPLGTYNREEGSLICEPTQSLIFESGTYMVEGSTITFISTEGEVLSAQYMVRLSSMILTVQSEGVLVNFVYGRR